MEQVRTSTAAGPNDKAPKERRLLWWAVFGSFFLIMAYVLGSMLWDLRPQSDLTPLFAGMESPEEVQALMEEQFTVGETMREEVIAFTDEHFRDCELTADVERFDLRCVAPKESYLINEINFVVFFYFDDNWILENVETEMEYLGP